MHSPVGPLCQRLLSPRFCCLRLIFSSPAPAALITFFHATSFTPVVKFEQIVTGRDPSYVSSTLGTLSLLQQVQIFPPLAVTSQHPPRKKWSTSPPGASIYHIFSGSIPSCIYRPDSLFQLKGGNHINGRYRTRTDTNARDYSILFIFSMPTFPAIGYPYRYRSNFNSRAFQFLYTLNPKAVEPGVLHVFQVTLSKLRRKSRSTIGEVGDVANLSPFWQGIARK